MRERLRLHPVLVDVVLAATLAVATELESWLGSTAAGSASWQPLQDRS